MAGNCNYYTYITPLSQSPAAFQSFLCVHRSSFYSWRCCSGSGSSIFFHTVYRFLAGSVEALFQGVLSHGYDDDHRDVLHVAGQWTARVSMRSQTASTVSVSSPARNSTAVMFLGSKSLVSCCLPRKVLTETVYHKTPVLIGAFSL